LEWLGWLRAYIWKQAGFGDLRKIRYLIEDYEPRFDPTVIRLEDPIPTKDDNITTPSLEPRKEFPRKYYTAADYQALYKSGELTPTAVAKAILPLIRRDTSPPGKFSIGWFDSRVDLVLKAAEASTLRYKEKRPLGPLDGVPTGIKDEFDIDGYRTTLGSVNDYTVKVPEGDSISAWCVRKLDEAGAINMGKLSMHEFGLGKSHITYIGSHLS